MKNSARFVLVLIKYKLTHAMVFRLSFFGACFVDGSMFALQLAMMSAIYSQVDAIGDWGRGAMIIFIGTYSLLNAINMTIYFFGLNGIPGKVRSGELDHYVTKPVSPLLRLTFESVDLGSAPLIALSIVIILYGVGVAGVAPTAGQVALYCVLILLMVVLYYDLEVILRTIAFFTLASGDVLGEFEGAAFSLCMKLPGTLLKGLYKAVFWFALPYGVMATVPSRVLMGILEPESIAYAAFAAVAFTFIAVRFFYYGLRHYKSASS